MTFALQLQHEKVRNDVPHTYVVVTATEISLFQSHIWFECLRLQSDMIFE